MGKKSLGDFISLVGSVLLIGLGIWNVLDYFFLGETFSFVAALSMSLLFCFAALTAWHCRLPLLWIPIAVGSAVLFFCSNLFEVLSNLPYLFFWIVSTIVALASLVVFFKERTKPKISPLPLGCFLLVFVNFFGFWGLTSFFSSKSEFLWKEMSELWAVPDRFDKAACKNKGTLEEIFYTTKAYATDSREVQKRAFIYLPFGYDEEKSYDILYLLHGTGDREDYWLKRFSYNKVMLDNLIDRKIIKPVIVVTPTWYVENDCADELDKLTYSFQKELRNDLMPFVESHYATYAKGTTPSDFEESRDHRAFAGLSRGSVTTFHSAFNGSLDYFSYFGCYSGCRTSEAEFANGFSSEENQKYAVNYFYNTSGSFDFMLKEHLKTYRALVKREDRLVEGENCSFDVFPMCYHSMTSWHIALYNTLIKFYG
ncbi:MAG: hypothetical protein J6D37_07400 [Clostridia bacterium]|nr:hypothetical protein [Clostridia bacterium]